MGLGITDYIVFGVTILFSVAIGIYYAIKEKRRTTEDYLIAGRKLHIIPASISLMITFLSAITILGDSAENYFFGISYSMYIIGSLFAVLIVAYVFVPLLYPLKLTSVQKVYY